MKPNLFEAIHRHIKQLHEIIDVKHVMMKGRLSSVDIDMDSSLHRILIFNEWDEYAIVNGPFGFLKCIDIIRTKPDAVFGWFMGYLEEIGHGNIAARIRHSADCTDSVMIPGFDADSWIKAELLGCGAFGNTYQWQSQNNPAKRCAIDEIHIPLEQPQRDRMMRIVTSEKKVLHSLMKMGKCPNIVSILQVSCSESTLYVVMEYMHGGDLDDFICKYGSQNVETVIFFLSQIMNGLLFLHSHRIAHYYMKPSNILLDNAQYPKVVKICDFTLSEDYSDMESIDETKVDRGTRQFMAPEIYDNLDGHRQFGSQTEQTDPEDRSTYDLKSDIWSVGVIGLHLAVGDLIEIGSPLDTLVLLSKYGSPSSGHNLVVGILQNLLVVDQHKRPDAKRAMQIIEDPSGVSPLSKQPPEAVSFDAQISSMNLLLTNGLDMGHNSNLCCALNACKSLDDASSQDTAKIIKLQRVLLQYMTGNQDEHLQLCSGPCSSALIDTYRSQLVDKFQSMLPLIIDHLQIRNIIDQPQVESIRNESSLAKKTHRVLQLLQVIDEGVTGLHEILLLVFGCRDNNEELTQYEILQKELIESTSLMRTIKRFNDVKEDIGLASYELRFASQLRKWYNHQFLFSDHLGEKIGLLENTYIPLTWEASLELTKKSDGLSAIYGGLQPDPDGASRVIIVAGISKTTTLKKICYDWSTGGDIARQYQLVIFLPMSLINPTECQNAEDALQIALQHYVDYHPSWFSGSRTLDKQEIRQYNNVLFLLDDYDGKILMNLMNATPVDTVLRHSIVATMSHTWKIPGCDTFNVQLKNLDPDVVLYVIDQLFFGVEFARSKLKQNLALLCEIPALFSIICTTWQRIQNRPRNQYNTYVNYFINIIGEFAFTNEVTTARALFEAWKLAQLLGANQKHNMTTPCAAFKSLNRTYLFQVALLLINEQLTGLADKKHTIQDVDDVKKYLLAILVPDKVLQQEINCFRENSTSQEQDLTAIAKVLQSVEFIRKLDHTGIEVSFHWLFLSDNNLDEILTLEVLQATRKYYSDFNGIVDISRLHVYTRFLIYNPSINRHTKHETCFDGVDGILKILHDEELDPLQIGFVADNQSSELSCEMAYDWALDYGLVSSNYDLVVFVDYGQLINSPTVFETVLDAAIFQFRQSSYFNFVNESSLRRVLQRICRREKKVLFLCQGYSVNSLGRIKEIETLKNPRIEDRLNMPPFRQHLIIVSMLPFNCIE